MAKPDPWRLDPAHYPFSTPVATRWADLDPLGHINNVSMAGLFEEGRGRFNRSLALDHHGGVRWLVVAVELAYLAEAHHPIDVVVGSGIGRIGKGSWTIFSAAFQNGLCVATCDTTIAFTDGSKPVPFPESYRATFEALMAGKRP